MPTDPLTVRHFDDPLPLDSDTARRWWGSKAFAIAEMAHLGVRVPPGFILGTALWQYFRDHDHLPTGLREVLRTELERVERASGLRFGDPTDPLLLAVRSGAPTSMPGMLDTVLNVGVNSSIAAALAARHEASPMFEKHLRRRFLSSYGRAACGIPESAFSAIGGAEAGDEEAVEAQATAYQRLLEHETGRPVPSDPWTQLEHAVEGVLRSWWSPRATKYRAAHGIADDEGTGVTIQAMVFGDLDPSSGSGVVFTRDPTTGASGLFGEWLPCAQGEDVVSGRRTPYPISRSQIRRGMKDRSLETAMPQAFAELRAIATLLESHFDETQDIEFSVERGQLFVLQTRGAKLTPAAAVRIAVELVEEGRISADRALRQIDAGSLRNLLIPRLPAPEELAQRGVHAVARGLAASRGAAAGCIVLDAAAAETRPGEDRILVRSDTSSEDVDTMRKVAGVLTAAGGLTSHAAVVARAMGKPCITGATELHVDYQTRTVLAHGERRHVFREGEALTIDGSRGLIYSGELPVEPAPSSPHVQVILRWADERRQAQVFAESRNPRAARVGMSFGADGVLVPLAHDGSTKDFRRAVGDHAPIVWAVDAESAPLAAKDLRPGRDILLVEADHEVGSIRASCSGFELWSVRSAEGVDAIVSSSSPPPGQTAWAAHGEAALTVGAVDVKPRALIVSPLDIPVARVRAACIE